MLLRYTPSFFENIDVEFHDDADWRRFPEVGAKLRGRGVAEVSMCLATCVQLRIWSIGIAGKSKDRQRVAKLSLCVALRSCQRDANPTAWPAFDILCDEVAAGKQHESNGTSAGGSNGTKAANAPQTHHPKGSVVPLSASAPPHRTAPSKANEVPEQMRGCMWLRCRQEPLRIEDRLCPLQGPALMHTDNLKELARSAHLILDELLGTEIAACDHVTFEDNPDVCDFPEIRDALLDAGTVNVSFCVSICARHGLWAVGCSPQVKTRKQAAKLAMCVALALCEHSGVSPEVFSARPDFDSLCDSVSELVESDVDEA